MVPKSKSQSILFQILKALKEKRPKDARIGFDKILSNHESARAEMGQTDKNLLIKQLELENQSPSFGRTDDNSRAEKYIPDNINGWIVMLKNLANYYYERERAGEKVEEYFKVFFESCSCLIVPETRLIFAYVHKQVIKEYLGVVKKIKEFAKDREAVIRASHASKNLENYSVNILIGFARVINENKAQELKLVNSNQSMKIYFLNFKFDRAAGCDKVLQEKQLLDQSPQQDIITYNYYKGRILIFQSEFAKASRHLQAALDMCPNTAKGQKFAKQVLKYLIPVNLFLGKHPDDNVLNQLEEYRDVCRSVRQGSIRLLQQVIEQYRILWIKRSLLILMDQLKVLCYRNLCKKVYLIENKDNKIYLDQLLKAFQLSHPENQPPSIPEVCCIIANLIYLELIRGKIFQDAGKKVHAITLGQNPFNFKRPEDINWQK